MRKRNATPPKKKPVSDRRRSGRVGSGDLAVVDNPRLYVGNLDPDTTESDLDDLFRGAGTVLAAEIVTNSRTQQSKGYGFVEMSHIDEARRAVQVLHDQDFRGRRLKVSAARSEGPDSSRGPDDSPGDGVALGGDGPESAAA